MTGPDRSHRLLTELVTGALDPGYAAAARRRGGRPARAHWYDRPAVALGCLLAGFVLVVAWIHTNRGAPAAARVQDDLVTRVRDAQSAADDLAGQADRLSGRLARARAQALPGSGGLAAALTREQLVAGAVAVHGPGIDVTLTDPAAAPSSSPAGRAGTTPITSTNILTDRDVRSVVDELWHDGAEAVAVNGVRLTPTSAIRFAGQAVLVDFQPVTSPYTIEAVGNANRLVTAFAQSAVAGRYQTLASADGIGFTFAEQDDVALPAGTPGTVRYASPVPSPSGSPVGHR